MRWPTAAWPHCLGVDRLRRAACAGCVPPRKQVAIGDSSKRVAPLHSLIDLMQGLMKKAHTATVVVAIALAVGAAWWLQNRPAAGTPGAIALVSGASAAGGSRAGGPGAAGAAGTAGAGGPVAVEVGKVSLARLEDDDQAVGTLRSNQSVMLRPEVSGRVVKLGFADGQRV